MNSAKYFILIREKGQIVAMDGPPGDVDWPKSLCLRGVQYVPLQGEDTFFFWDELRDQEGATVGYTIILPKSPSFRESYFIRNSHNVTIDGYEDATVLLQPCDRPTFVCVQGFGAEVFVREDDHRDCVIYMFDWSQNRMAFPLRPLVLRIQECVRGLHLGPE